MSPPMDWLSRLLEMTPVRGRLDLRCYYGAPWRIDQASAAPGEIPYHVVLAGSAVLEDPTGGPPQHLAPGDILLIAQGGAHTLHDGSGARPVPARERAGLNLTFSENAGSGERLDMLCGHFVLAAPHERLLRSYLPSRLVARASAGQGAPGATAAQVASLVTLMRTESAAEHLGGHAMLNALSTALFALALRLSSESGDAPAGLLALAGNPRLAPAITAMFERPAHPWTLPALARLCNVSRATLVRLFNDSLGRSASELLTDIRMTLAASELRKANQSTGAVAEAVGYQSEAAFQRAFKQHMGVTPARWRRAAVGGGVEN
ncbi:AraC family transcriptional regulator [Frateuria sp. STR12]|uniref:AraC family transcriptional regulator n=1 Tax=Frateuria hangzhouensis TaxID=2995589 RepID=UPI0022610220|nr:AraC family transcriptional regulator [Frateuria sp. STR12]MCX7513067.1 AraC family transcriptional regulator [Frateuria sp. STR12]